MQDRFFEMSSKDLPYDDLHTYGKFWVFERGSVVPADVLPRIPATFERIGPGAALFLADAMGLPDADSIIHRFTPHRRCYTAWVDNVIAAYGWVSFEFEDIGEINLRLRLRPAEAYVWDCATLPEFRRQGLYSSLLTHILRELRAENLERVWIGAEAANLPSLKGIARAGFMHVADVFEPGDGVGPNRIVVGYPGVSASLVDTACWMLSANQAAPGTI